MRNLITGEWYTLKKLEKNQIEITGYCNKQQVLKGSRLCLFTEPPTNYEVTNVIYKTHKGVFIDNKNAVNSHYTAICILINE